MNNAYRCDGCGRKFVRPLRVERCHRCRASEDYNRKMHSYRDAYRPELPKEYAEALEQRIRFHQARIERELAARGIVG